MAYSRIGKFGSSAVLCVGTGLALLAGNAPALADCNPASIDPSCPIGMLGASNASNPSSPLSINNPANPASPFNLSNPANPASPLNPNNSANHAYVQPGSPNPYPYYRRPNIFDLIGPQATNDPQELEPTEPYAPAPRRHHKRHRRHTHLR